ncbi:MAG: NAD(P)H-hydrate dehydratase, partial [Myxococcales bacterium]|nr:NAD(P)H-hydrate dehydratase [Myxococcales bacterium]
SLWTRAPGLAAPPELMVHHLDDSGNDGERILVAAEGAAAVVVGPGLGIDGPGRTLSKLLVEKLPAPAVIDADALSALADDPGPAQRAVTPRVWTPHPGEAARLLRTTAAEVEANRYQGARELVDRYGHVAVLKGAFTIVADATRQWVSGGAAPALAVGGAGDVLAGVIGAQLAFLSPMEASAAGAFVHWKAGTDMAFDRGNLAREIADAIGSVLMDAAAP